MKIEQIYTGCLAHGAYYIESNGEAAIIDPLRETEPYINRAKKDGATIRYILETHFHADFVSGHLDLSNDTGATIIYGPTAKPAFAAHVANDGDELKLGNVTIKVLHTPGHTMESTCYLLKDENGKDCALFCGDTLFIGDVGRPDLAQKLISELTQEKLAAHLYDSLRNKIMPLADDIIVYPGHGAGSACGKNMSKETTDTLGHQKMTNYALRADMTKEEFIQEVLSGLVTPPQYFPMNVLMNIKGYESIHSIINRAMKPLGAAAFEAAAQETDALILDTRSAEEFCKGFIPGSINISLNGTFAPWVGTLINNLTQPLLLVTDEGKTEEAITRLSRVGYDNTMGYLEGGIETWKKAGKPVETIASITVAEFAAIHKKNPSISILDVRKKSEYDAEHIIGAKNLPLDFINDYMSEVNRNETYYVHCAGGYRSMIFASILKARGYDHLININGGFNEIKKSGEFSITDYVCPTTML
jgi:glyoxylase-like metal-dependent hydrolase (beta-lactamase superfamily II)/rhodanese-related sulfurtransferase